jgi:hypothetical protein
MQWTWHEVNQVSSTQLEILCGNKMQSCSNFCCSDLVLCKTPYVVGNVCFSQPRNHSGDMVVGLVHSVSVLGSITFCLLDVVGLCLEKVIFLRCLPLAILCCCDSFPILIRVTNRSQCQGISLYPS